MWIDNKIVKEDLEYINSCDFISWNKLRNKTIFITGATGLIGQNLVNGLLYANIKRNLNLKVIGLVRNLDQAKKKFESQLQDTNVLEFVVGDVRTFEYPTEKIDYIVHGASITSSKDFVRKSNEVKSISIEGTKHLLELARLKKVSSFVYLSSMEVYGYPKKGHICTEDESWDFDPNEPRNSYPLAKLECERLCKEYNIKYCVPTKTIRLAQTFGLGIDINDNRIFAYFARCVLNNEDIVLHTKGETERCYLYTADAVTAILTVLLKNSSNEIYNVANPETYCSIKDMAEIVKNKIADNTIDVNYSIDNIERGYNNTTHYNLSVDKILKLKWLPKYNLISSYQRMINAKINRKIMVVAMHLKNGGAERVLSLLINRWLEKGYNICLVLTDNNNIKSNSYYIDSKIETINIEPANVSNKIVKKIKIINSLIEIANTKKDYTIVSFVNPCITILAIVSFFVKNRIVFSERCDPYHSPKCAFKRTIRNLSFKRADACVFQTKEAMSYFPKSIQKKGVVINNPVSNTLPEIKDIELNPNRIIMACRLDKQKNVLMAIKAFKEVIKDHPNYVLEIYGNGEEYYNLIKEIEKNELERNVHIYSFVDNIYDVMKESKILLSTSNYEGISNSILEAMAIGVPCICTDCPIGGSKLLINNEINGILIPVNDHILLSKAINKLIENTDYMKKISNSSKQVREKYSINKIEEKWMRVL